MFGIREPKCLTRTPRVWSAPTSLALGRPERRMASLLRWKTIRQGSRMYFDAGPVTAAGLSGSLAGRDWWTDRYGDLTAKLAIQLNGNLLSTIRMRAAHEVAAVVVGVDFGHWVWPRPNFPRYYGYLK
jgi:hypothetical protein